ncbi:aldehyde dehydrogenase [Polaribacter pacificus]|uniref:Aldehyde dehydrogenase n=1 Tax=Polaribacter pacificus TaxID=1775173 RepID=A0A917MDJ5_9FLAO|nr:aldehyde dehydrogenase [Polaribacter pacificus]GGG95564.1 aldehyde dehydrogenase [Polaribacter pacificus]
MDIPKLVQEQKHFFKSQQTKNLDFRISLLKKLLVAVQEKEQDIISALHKDFKKSEYESVMTETSIVISELKSSIKNLRSWAKPKRVFPALLNFPSSSKIYKEPYGAVLVISPWNYPYQLALVPLIGAIAAGNTVVLKPSELTPHTSKITKEIIEAVFASQLVAVVEGGVEVSTALLEERWDYIFFTGSVQVGKIIAKAAAKHLTPITLELGGKNPCIIDDTAAIALAAKRIVWGKCINAGQTCIAPDYLIIHKKVKDEFVRCFQEEVTKAYGLNPQESKDYPRIVNEKNFDRLANMLSNEKILVGGNTDKETLYIAPTLIDNPSMDSEVMKGEIFGPISPVLTYKDEAELEALILRYEKPLALYVFTKRTAFAKQIIRNFSFGGGTINDTTVHFANSRLPFGGVGESGIGNYHGKRTFDLFSHHKGMVHRYNWLDVPVRYAPYKGKVALLKKFMNLFS